MKRIDFNLSGSQGWLMLDDSIVIAHISLSNRLNLIKTAQRDSIDQLTELCKYVHTNNAHAARQLAEDLDISQLY